MRSIKKFYCHGSSVVFSAQFTLEMCAAD